MVLVLVPVPVPVPVPVLLPFVLFLVLVLLALTCSLGTPPFSVGFFSMCAWIDLQFKMNDDTVPTTSRSISPRWGSIRFRLAPRTYAPWVYAW